ncbi:Lnb N-terminal periplasmic domain-containing protein [Vibrio azureus]|uniref:Lnb N-terminal periplasmic domain-containing protein n=1 Tax=Vibrio azureus TaxID=512649 RepID=UPI001D0FCA64|nr:DUF4105 domain-containing protein [Vibrio azureus]
MNKITLYLLTLSFSIISNFSFCHDNDRDVKNDWSYISSLPKWLLLTHHEEGFLSSGSSVSTNGFFLSLDGKKDPEKELEATVKAFLKNPDSQCRFPARKIWIKQVMPDIDLPKVNCPDYENYINKFRTDSISVIYASGYLGNPASMYGHVLLKFNGNNNRLLDNTFSYGAQVPNNENKIVYMYQGITGGYQGHFSNQKYHHQNLVYNESELRDLWEYKLNVSQDKIDFLLAHLWELENAHMDYYFFKQNCGYQLAKLLELILDRPLLVAEKSWVVPYDLIMMLNLGNKESSLIDDVIYHESRQEKLYKRFSQLNAREKSYLEKLITLPTEATLEEIRTLSEREAKRVIDVMYDYFAFIEVKNNGLNESETSKRDILLKERFRLPAGEVVWKEEKYTPPHHAQKTAMIQISPTFNSELGRSINLRFRASYYDFLNLNTGRVPFSELSLFDVNFLYSQTANSLSLRELRLFNIKSLNVSNTELEQDESFAWALSSGYKPSNLSCLDCSNLFMEGFLGKSLGLNEHSAVYAALAGELQLSDLTEAKAYIGPELGAVFNITPYWATSLKLGSHFKLNDMEQHKNYFQWEQRFLQSRDFDLRTSILYDEAFEYTIKFSIYW